MKAGLRVGLGRGSGGGGGAGRSRDPTLGLGAALSAGWGKAASAGGPAGASALGSPAPLLRRTLFPGDGDLRRQQRAAGSAPRRWVREVTGSEQMTLQVRRNTASKGGAQRTGLREA